MRNEYKILSEAKNNMGYLGTDGRITLKQTLKTCGVRVLTGLIWLRIWSSVKSILTK
jgi:hypothetical protein